MAGYGGPWMGNAGAGGDGGRVAMGYTAVRTHIRQGDGQGMEQEELAMTDKVAASISEEIVSFDVREMAAAYEYLATKFPVDIALKLVELVIHERKS